MATEAQNSIIVSDVDAMMRSARYALGELEHLIETFKDVETVEDLPLYMSGFETHADAISKALTRFEFLKRFTYRGKDA